MKNETKYKIIQWVTRLLKYYPPVCPPINEETKKIITIRSKRVLFQWDGKHESDHIMSSAICKELMKNKLIEIEKVKQGSDAYLFTAKLNVVK